MGSYHIWLILSGNKEWVEGHYAFDSEREWEEATESLPYDIVDYDDHNVWFDYGDR